MISVRCSSNRCSDYVTYSPRSAYDGVSDLSIYIHRDHRGKGVGKQLLQKLEEIGKQNNFYKFLLFTFPFNTLGQSLYHNARY
ncbi:GNAT family N-acetyltransferase [Paenibacillus sp. JGP012]|uniref:GNAT family N-acetyltransferase n=1 Tax=Paenibacillus sp. JGP012 TaxID=2735914 RepID=UPI0021AA6FD4|nr:GNAT family N-acetyltransferase [Paenibacillus sp. JGP012]